MKSQYLVIAFLISFLSFSCQKDDDIAPPLPKPTDTVVTTDSTDNGKTEEQEQRVTQSLLWEISGNGLVEPAHLFGTIHYISQEDFAFGDQLDSLVSTASSLMLEVDQTDHEILEAAQARVVMPGGVSIDELYTPYQQSNIEKTCTQVNLSWNAYQRLMPIALQSILYKDIAQKERGPQTGYEQFLMSRAQRYGIKLEGAESKDYVYSYFDRLDVPTQAQQLAQMTGMYQRNVDSVVAEMEYLTNIYLAQDVESLQELTMTKDGLEQYNILVKERNHAWMPTIEAGLDGRFIGVGAAHLAGKHGLVQLLRNKGYKVEPVILK